MMLWRMFETSIDILRTSPVAIVSTSPVIAVGFYIKLMRSASIRIETLAFEACQHVVSPL